MQCVAVPVTCHEAVLEVRELAPALECGSASYRHGIEEGGAKPPHSRACGMSKNLLAALG